MNGLPIDNTVGLNHTYLVEFKTVNEMMLTPQTHSILFPFLLSSS